MFRSSKNHHQASKNIQSYSTNGIPFEDRNMLCNFTYNLNYLTFRKVVVLDGQLNNIY
jgi:hypothetical protein